MCQCRPRNKKRRVHFPSKSQLFTPNNGIFGNKNKENGLGSNFASQMAPLDPSAIVDRLIDDVRKRAGHSVQHPQIPLNN